MAGNSSDGEDIRAKIAMVQELFTQINGEDQAQAISLMQQLMGHVASTCEPNDVASILLGHVTPSTSSGCRNPGTAGPNIGSFATSISPVKQETSAMVEISIPCDQHQTAPSHHNPLQFGEDSCQSATQYAKQRTAAHHNTGHAERVVKRKQHRLTTQSVGTGIRAKRGRPRGSKNKSPYKKDELLPIQSSADSQHNWTESYGHKRKNPNPQKFSSDGDDDVEDGKLTSADYDRVCDISINNDNNDDIDEKEMKNKLKYSCDKCSVFKSAKVGIAKYIRHMKLHNDALLSCRGCRKVMYSIAELEHHKCIGAIVETSSAAKTHRFREVIKCKACGISLRGKRIYNHHMKSKHGQKRRHACPFTCKFCSKAFPRKLTLFSHMKIHIPDQYICVQCGKILDTEAEYKTHIKEHDKQLLNMCFDCDQIFVDPLKFKLHMRLHEVRSCSTCKKKFTNATLLRQHVCRPRVAALPMKYTCNYCGKVFPRPWLLQVHVRLHTGEKPVECKLCNIHFRTLKALAKHKQTYAHMKRSGQVIKEKQHICDMCGRAYFRKQALQRHQKYHTGIRPHRCPHCDYRCPEANNLKRHIALHFKSSRNFMCEICGASFHAKKTLEMHNTYKHSETRSFSCTVCSMAFKASNALRRHMKSHSSEKPFKCFCGATFNRQYNLRRHMRAVHGSDETLAPVKRVSVLDAPVIEKPVVTPPVKKATKTKRSIKNPNIVQQLTAIPVPDPSQVIQVPDCGTGTSTPNPHCTSHIILAPSALLPSQISLATAMPLAPPTYTKATIPFTVQALACQPQHQPLSQDQPSSAMQQQKYIAISPTHIHNRIRQSPVIAAAMTRGKHVTSSLSNSALQTISLQNLPAFQLHDISHAKQHRQLEDSPSPYPYYQQHQQTLITVPPPQIPQPIVTTPEENAASAKTLYAYHQPHDLLNTCSPAQATAVVSSANNHRGPHEPVSHHILIQEQGSSLSTTVANHNHQHASLPMTLNIDQPDMALSSERSTPLITPTQTVQTQHSGTLPIYSNHDSVHSSYVDSAGRHIIMFSSSLLPPVVEMMQQQQPQHQLESQQVEIDAEHYLLPKREVVQAPVVTENIPYQTTDGLPVMLQHINSAS